jgi:2-polyprenyl-3-methyl-5-hydroxy-6-metoxy-1,4-benzoquinol methylase
MLQVRRVFSGVRRASWEDGADGWSGDTSDAILLFGSSNVLVMAKTLSAMRACLNAGAGVVFPNMLSDALSGTRWVVHTLRAFEALEAHFLSPKPGLPTGRHMPAPVAMLSRAAFAGLTEQYAITTQAALLDLLEEAWDHLGALCVGLAHDFVDYYGEAREDVIPFIPKHAKDILEVGCARGATGQLLQERLGCQVTGVELNPVVAQQASWVLHHVIPGDFERLSLEGTFDVVLATELFEHLLDPFAFLAKARSLVRPGGRIVLSVPNIGHHSVVEDLLAGRWDYLPIGLLCYTHLRFFTERTLRDWIEMAGYATFEIVPQTTELPPRFLALTPEFAVDSASLQTSGFWVSITV